MTFIRMMRSCGGGGGGGGPDRIKAERSGPHLEEQKMNLNKSFLMIAKCVSQRDNKPSKLSVFIS